MDWAQNSPYASCWPSEILQAYSQTTTELFPSPSFPWSNKNFDWDILNSSSSLQLIKYIISLKD